MQDFDHVLHAFFPNPTVPVKFNLITAMKQLFGIMLKDETSLVLQTPSNDKQILLNSASIPMGKTNFKKFFKLSTTCIEKQNKEHICIGCHMLSNCTLSNIKFRSPDGNLLAECDTKIISRRLSKLV